MLLEHPDIKINKLEIYLNVDNDNEIDKIIEIYKRFEVRDLTIMINNKIIDT